MQHISTTPFGRRTLDAGLMAARQLAETAVPDRSIDKYKILTALTQARAAFRVTDRDLAVLSALVSFHQDRELGGDDLIVFPSNAALSERAHGMAESTLRRHLRALVQAGLILRHDSPNGKRYATRGSTGALRVAFGFDLKPLVIRADEIFAAAQAACEAAETLRRLRERVVLQLRDARKLIEYAQETLGINTDALDDQQRLLSRALRRKLDQDEIKAMARQASELLTHAKLLFPNDKTEEMNGNVVQNERHIQYSTKSLYESEPSKKMEELEPSAPPRPTDDRDLATKLPLGLVLKTVPDLRDYAPDGIKDWHQFVVTAAFVRGMLGISEHAWLEACRIMGDVNAAITVACMLQRAEHIAKPGGYLRSLSARAADGAFTPGPMVMALLRAENVKAA
ncbi:plasmid replication protein RepC [Aliiroseovarius sediminis]|uniref:plasmid replication protein RepC n=1 Tax=Aliiroseovarius sediminis TaxID=2925839 RepID=UPI001F5AF9FC|nr:plasmid replication protein RepC [Aliiroseovarius sediminis]MCI2396008.1 replication initiation protein RepC [Aliiroseovarius sediminis]